MSKWKYPKPKMGYFDPEGYPLPRPKTKTPKKLRKEAETRANTNARYRWDDNKDGYARRAYIYAHTMLNLPAPMVRDVLPADFYLKPYVRRKTNGKFPSVIWDRDPRDRKWKVRCIITDKGPYVIPHWDFVPEEPVDLRLPFLIDDDPES